MCGRVVLLSGSRGTLGAAHLCTAGAVRGGAGLVSLGALPDAYDLLATTVMPEVMVRPFEKLTDVFNFPVDAIGIGPGLGSGQEARPRPGSTAVSSSTVSLRSASPKLAPSMMASVKSDRFSSVELRDAPDRFARRRFADHTNAL
ncbi:MAG: NAD(P)H-hydrate dehydratase [Ilumatobacteraceae bacterium]